MRDLFAFLLGPLLASPLLAQTADPDTDGDGLSDFQERHKYFTNPASADSDGDGIPDGDWNERREYAYTVRTIVQVLPPVTRDVLHDDYQDARILEEREECVDLEVVHYPLNTVSEAIVGDPNWRADAARLREYLDPGLTANWDAEMRGRLLAALAPDGIHVDGLDDKEVVERASKWLLGHAKFVDGFTTFCTTFRDRKAAVYPGLERSAEEGKAEKGLTLEEQWERELFAKGMFEHGVRGSCTSTAIYLNGCLRAIGIPTRIVLAIPLVDSSDAGEVDLVRKRLTHPEVRRIVLDGIVPLGKSWSSHTFNEVFVGGRWRRLNGDRLGQNILGRGAIGMMTHVATFGDWAEGEMAKTWGMRQARGLRDDVFGGANPYSTIALSDRFGEHAAIPEESALESGEFRRLTIDRLVWSDDPVLPAWIRDSFAEERPVLLGHVAEDDPFEKTKAFTEEVDPRFFLEAEGHPTLKIAAATGGISEGERTRFVVLPLGPADWRDLVRGVEYSLRAQNSKPGYGWVVKEGLAVARAR